MGDIILEPVIGPSVRDGRKEGEMPREYVAFEEEHSENKPGISYITRLDVSWDRHENVVLTHRQFINGSWSNESEGECHDNELTHVVGTKLNRKEINDLIRNLRKARDQAYGKDE